MLPAPAHRERAIADRPSVAERAVKDVAGDASRRDQLAIVAAAEGALAAVAIHDWLWQGSTAEIEGTPPR